MMRVTLSLSLCMLMVLSGTVLGQTYNLDYNDIISDGWVLIKNDGSDKNKLNPGDNDNEMKVQWMDFKYSTSLLKYDLSSIPAGSDVVSAELDLFITRDIYWPTWDLYVFQVEDTTNYGGTAGDNDWNDDAVFTTYDGANPWQGWDESAGAWDTTGWADAARVESTMAVETIVNPGSAGGWITVDVTDIVDAWIDDGDANYGFMLKATSDVPPPFEYWDTNGGSVTMTDPVDIRIASSVWATPCERPMLTVTVPEPTIPALLMFGIVGLIGFRRIR